MSKEAVRLFIKKVEQDEKLQAIVLDGFESKETTTLNLADLGREHGFEFTEEEGLEVWSEFQNKEELSDFALELVSGGAPVNCNSGTNDISTK